VIASPDYDDGRYWHDTPVTQDGDTRPLDDLLDDPSRISDAPLLFPDGAVLPATALREFITGWWLAAASGLVDCLGGAECGSALWALAHRELDAAEGGEAA
jgi:hypothetical protein